MKAFLDLQPRIWRDLYTFCILSTADAPTLTLQLQSELEARGFTPDKAAVLAPSLLKFFQNIKKEDFVNPNEEEATLSAEDISLLKEKLLHEPSQEARRLLTAFLVYSRANPHPSFWIKYDRKVIMFLASLDKLKVSEQISLTNHLHNLYNLDMRVVGSNQPTPCFRFEWQATESPIDDTKNPLVLIGPLNPATIKAFVSRLPYESQEDTTDAR